ncbi:hypothetical protein H5410_013390 [Solanum commersonii]|uniref:Uncharacterized protein n=1 Tax=Solanum commersonii TaxID=4109 RepID=A0A9J6AUR4_SOLCO|nr:hypothetical protein H5410_013390 [Solanum commersonii]
MSINSTDYNLIIVGKYPTSFLSQGQVDVHPRLENRNSVDGFPITQSTDFPNMTHYQNILTGRYDFDLNEIINENNRDLPNYSSPSASDSDDLPNAEESGDNVPFEASFSDDDFLMPNRSPRPMSMSPFHGEESFPLPTQQLVVTSSMVHMPEFRNHEITYLDHLSDGPDIFGDTHDEYISQRTWREPQNFMNDAIYIEKGMLFNSKKQLQKAVKLLHLNIVSEYFIIKST